MIAFIDDYREAHGVEPQSGSRPICKVLPIAPSTHHEHAAKGADPAKLSRPGKAVWYIATQGRDPTRVRRRFRGPRRVLGLTAIEAGEF
jgi:putative transposase